MIATNRITIQLNDFKLEIKIEEFTCCSKQSGSQPRVQKPVYEWLVYCPVVVQYHLLMKRKWRRVR
jgi:hypothetical protein